jgi:hypothetical protein
MRSVAAIFKNHIAAALSFLISAHAAAGIIYEPKLNAVIVTDFAKQAPCQPERLAAMDRLCGWGKVSYDEASAVCSVSCDLIVGWNDGTDTYFQVASEKRPSETLSVAGNIYVAPYHIAGENKGEHWWRTPEKVNRIALGSEENPSFRGAVRLECGNGKKYSLSTGSLPRANGGKEKNGRGGQLLMFNSSVTAPGSGADNRISRLSLKGDGFIMENSEISRVGGMMSYGAREDWKNIYRINNSVFADGGVAIAGGGRQFVTGATFRNCAVALQDYGSLDMEISDCVFEGNSVNFQLCYPGKKQPRITLVDCVVGAPLKGDDFKLLAQPKPGELTPELVVRRHIIVEIADAAGKPVPGAGVRVTSGRTGETEELKVSSGADGRTPGKGSGNAILLTDRIMRCQTQDPRPEITEFSYTVTASGGDKKAEIKDVRADASWKIVRLVLK